MKQHHVAGSLSALKTAKIRDLVVLGKMRDCERSDLYLLKEGLEGK